MSDDVFRPVINPFTFLVQLGCIVLFGGLLVYAVRTISANPSDFASVEIWLPGIFVFLFLGYILILIFYNLLDSLKFVTFTKNGVEAFYPLRLRRVRFDKSEIRGFTTCRIRFNLKSIILYSKSGEFIELTSKDIFAFKDLSMHMERSFIELGEEPFLPKT